MAVPNIDDEVICHTLYKIKVEYKWKPPHYLECHVFGPAADQCPKHVHEKPKPTVETSDDGNKQKERRLLWTELGIHKKVVRNSPWILMGDFNVALNLEDTYARSSFMTSAMYEFKDCITGIEVVDVDSSGLHYASNQKPKGGGGVLRKLDRIMGNIDFTHSFSGAYAIFQPYRISDHSPTVLKLPTLTSPKPKPFKFFNFLASKTMFIEVLESNWNAHIDGHNMFKVVSKMKILKKPLRKLLYEQGNLHERVNRLRIELDAVQKALDTNPVDLTLREEDCVYVQAFNDAKIDEERFLKQKAKVEWLAAEVSGSVVMDVFVSHYEHFLGLSMNCNDLNVEGLFSKLIPTEMAANMVRKISNNEIKATMSDIGDDRAPGPDGYTSILKEINHTFLDLIPKLINVCFADDLFMFARGDVESSRVIMDSLKEFKMSSGLVLSIPKSTMYFCNVLSRTKAGILCIMPFSEGEVPIKYLRVPLISLGLSNRDCKIVVEKAKNKIRDWKNKSLSFAGRLQLCQSIISSMHVYWDSILIILKGIIYDIHQLIRMFLWCNGELKRGKAKVAWEDICLPKCAGDLGLRNLEVLNFALMTTHIWNIVSSKESLWFC
ncbi:RNA-directed DNA polymerase, eukaryota, reverse transcriptase zinc-binding domain protein [Tanacetum coccineum]